MPAARSRRSFHGEPAPVNVLPSIERSRFSVKCIILITSLRIRNRWAADGRRRGGGGLDFTKDDENLNSQPFMHWRDRFLYRMEAVKKAEAESRQRKGQYMNVMAADMDEMYRRADFARDPGSVIIMIDLTVGFRTRSFPTLIGPSMMLAMTRMASARSRHPPRATRDEWPPS